MLVYWRGLRRADACVILKARLSEEGIRDGV